MKPEAEEVGRLCGIKGQCHMDDSLRIENWNVKSGRLRKGHGYDYENCNGRKRSIVSKYPGWDHEGKDRRND